MGAARVNRRRRLGQHFLADGRIARAICDALPDAPPRVVEIGPGKGALTCELVRRFPRVVAIEVDPVLAVTLPGRLGNPAGLEVVTGDALAVDLSALSAEGPWLAAGNLPYSVATPILRRCLGLGTFLVTLVFMVQEDVARRLVARPGEGARGLLTLEVEAAATAELLFTVPPRCFSPPPRVVSAVVRLRPRKPPCPVASLRRALALAAVAFQHRRKKLANALSDLAPREATAAAMATAGVAADARAEDVPLQAWCALARALPADREEA